ncbi:MAG TPA: aldo/keto reductase, partial [Polyangiaceae bacterium]|nr:aldo/keto reductase [Polyangiaceae bacterium]
MLTRRHFIAGSVALAACNEGASSAVGPGEARLPTITAADPHATMPMSLLGRTGERVSRIGLGGYHLGIPDEQEAIRIVRSAIDRGVTFMDNCWDYNDGKSEERMGKALRDGYRRKVFLMTKIDGRTRELAARQLDQSLGRLGTEVIDLVQIHEVIRASDPAACFAPGGCIEALLEAKKAGKLRYIGFTGHKDPSIHAAMLETADAHHFEFDTIMMPLNVMDAHFRSFEKVILPIALRKRMGILSMKPLGSGDILASHTVSAVECLQYALNLPGNVVITGCDSMGVLEQAIRTAIRFEPLTREQVDALLARTRDVAMSGRFERFKTTSAFDGTGR